ncbi:N-acetylmuramoyl-L-alanine amidase [Cytobacillus oceanisediminis]|uniref:N-acetylmuramoyl-L-alanine amidase n=1 Tax=Cytobacillus oceanisediminis TaxID=665099 RepID=A0A2V3A8J3_9BACI|nr:cell wall hydrolase [Cytobacillus oceanisediminis]PWW31243.1 N-acetylmuramoyl-L-alanine amidase [Cytobacillus oceanisediminis]
MNIIKWFTAVIAMVFVLHVGQTAAEASVLKNGSAGSEVTYLQSILEKLGYFETEKTGYFGPVTTNAVESFQRDFGLKVDGIVGVNTSEMLSNVDMMAHVVYGEARGESYEGQVAVAAVILNRVQSDEFPSTISNVIFQKNAYTAVSDGQYWMHPNDIAYRAVKDAYLGWDPSSGATYYYNPITATDQWIFTRTVIKAIGSHSFAY